MCFGWSACEARVLHLLEYGCGQSYQEPQYSRGEVASLFRLELG